VQDTTRSHAGCARGRLATSAWSRHRPQPRPRTFGRHQEQVSEMNPRVRRPLTLARLAGHRADGESERPGTAWLAGHRPDGARTAWESGRGGSGTHLRADRPFAL